MSFVDDLLSMAGFGGSAPAQSNRTYNPTANTSTGWKDGGGLISGIAAGAGSGNIGGLPGSGGSGGIFGGLFDNMLSKTNNATGITTQGWGDLAVGGMGSIFDLYSGMKQFGLAQDQFDEGKRQYDQNYQAQVKNYNTDLEDRQRARVAANPGAYQSVSDYMKKNRQV